jgi:hypothetical protein
MTKLRRNIFLRYVLVTVTRGLNDDAKMNAPLLHHSILSAPVSQHTTILLLRQQIWQKSFKFCSWIHLKLCFVRQNNITNETETSKLRYSQRKIIEINYNKTLH